MNAAAFERDSGLDEEMQMPSTESLWCANKPKKHRAAKICMCSTENCP